MGRTITEKLVLKNEEKQYFGKEKTVKDTRKLYSLSVCVCVC